VTILDWFKSESGQTLIAGMAGAATSAFHKWPGFYGAVRILVVGTAMAYYLGDYASPIFKWIAGIADLSLDRTVNSGAFLVGATGVVLFETILLAISLKKNELRLKGGNDEDAGDHRG
jgi:hypothetical protein